MGLERSAEVERNGAAFHLHTLIIIFLNAGDYGIIESIQSISEILQCQQQLVRIIKVQTSICLSSDVLLIADW